MKFKPYSELSRKQNRALKLIIRKAKKNLGAESFMYRIDVPPHSAIETTVTVLLMGGLIQIPIRLLLKWNRDKNMWES